ncbi:MAG: hypothetical protein GF364_14400 [Candidatus Lokiarchaeota archaeon]|nr:hypothetical protein [Candidatus Lokiarchaeota archaeon]
MKKYQRYKLMIGIYHHKLGPILISPKTNCDWLERWDYKNAIVKDGLNTKTSYLDLYYDEILIQTQKFTLNDTCLRGHTLRCALFVVVFQPIFKIPPHLLRSIVIKLKDIAARNDKRLNAKKVDTFILHTENVLNTLHLEIELDIITQIREYAVQLRPDLPEVTKESIYADLGKKFNNLFRLKFKSRETLELIY